MGSVSNPPPSRPAPRPPKLPPPPLDLPAPNGKEAEWALLRLAALYEVPAVYGSWQELADAIHAKIRLGGG